MSRRRRAAVRKIVPDPLFESELVARFICYIMKDGKKRKAEGIVYGAFDEVVSILSKKQSKAESDPKTASTSAAAKGKKNKSSSAEEEKQSIIVNARARKIALEKFEEVLAKISPDVEVRSRRVGGATYQVPVEVRAKRRMALAMRWLVQYSRERNEKTMVLRLANEILDVLEGRGGSMKQRENVHRMAKANQAYAHYRW